LRGASAGAVRVHGIGFGAGVESFAPLQQLACLSGGLFALSGCSVRSLREAFASVSSTITSTSTCSGGAAPGAAVVPRGPRMRPVDFELPEMGAFGRKGVLRFHASRTTFRYDGLAFHEQRYPGGEVIRRKRPYMRGGMRLVYGFRDREVVAEEDSWMVAKCSRYLDEALNKRVTVEAHAKCTAVARHFAARFNQQLRAAGAPGKATDVSGREQIAPDLFFVPCFVYEVQAILGADGAAPAPLPGGNTDEALCFAGERYLPGVFLKYNSNNGYVSESPARHHEAVQAFLHFSFAASGGTLLVADLQGVAREAEMLLTDPQVLSLSGGVFGPGDLGATGLRACLAAHRCGATCRRLGLKPVDAALLRRLPVGARSHGGSGTGGPVPAQRSSALSSANSWERCSSEVGAASAEWERLSERRIEEYALSDGEGPRSSQASVSSWVHLMET